MKKLLFIAFVLAVAGSASANTVESLNEVWDNANSTWRKMQSDASGNVKTVPGLTQVRAINNTCYEDRQTITVTGHGWIDTRGASSIVVTVRGNAPGDYAVRSAGPGASVWAEGSNEPASALPSSSTVPGGVWPVKLPTSAPAVVLGADQCFVVNDPPASMRFLWSQSAGSPGLTASIMYQINYPWSGSTFNESGPTPGMH